MAKKTKSKKDKKKDKKKEEPVVEAEEEEQEVVIVEPPPVQINMKVTKLFKTKNCPSKRAQHSFAYDKKNNQLYVFGGIGNDSKRFNEIHILRYNKRSWLKVTPTTATAPPLLCHDIVLRDTTPDETTTDPKKKDKPGKETIVAYGHHASSLVKNMYEYDLKDKKWSKVTPTGEPPLPSHGHSLLYHKATDSLYKFGGCDYNSITTPTNALHTCLIPGKKEKKKKKKKKPSKWFWSEVELAEGPTPNPRYGHFADWISPDVFLIHGGTNGKDNFDDAWIFNIETAQWTLIKPRTTNNPSSGRFHHGGVVFQRGPYMQYMCYLGTPYPSKCWCLSIRKLKNNTIVPEESFWSTVDLEGDSDISRRWGHSLHVMNDATSKKCPTLFSLFGSDIEEKFTNDMIILHDTATNIQVYAEDD